MDTTKLEEMANTAFDNIKKERMALPEGVEMQRNIFEGILKKKVSQITFSGHRVNDDYSLNKRNAIVRAVMSAFDEAAEHSVQRIAANIVCTRRGESPAPETLSTPAPRG